MKNYRFNILCSLFGFLLLSCNHPEKVSISDELPPIYPDYTNITIPYNIAPLNFILRDKPAHIEVVLKGNSATTTFMGTNKIQFSEDRWKKFLQTEQGNSVLIQVSAKIKGQWIKYKSFSWTITEDKIDPYLTYRLIEPAYEARNKIQLIERNLENFDERVLADNNLIGSSCINCHIISNQNPKFSFFHIQGEKGGMILNRDGRLQKINTQGISIAATYGNLHPSGKYGVFSTNISVSAFHTPANKKLEAYDSASDLIILDFDNNRIVRSPLVSGNENPKTFPVFSADGNCIYYCSAPWKPLPDSIKQLKYSLVKIDFDAQQGRFGSKIDTLKYSGEKDQSISFPKPSPDGHFILYSVSDYGSFPIGHRETDLQMLNLKTGESVDMDVVNSDYSDTYHSWSSNSRWFVFASKRDDGLYGKPYFCYVDEHGKVHKPFALPQRNPYYYDYTLKSFNIPELSTGKLPFAAADIEQLYWNSKIDME